MPVLSRAGGLGPPINPVVRVVHRGGARFVQDRLWQSFTATFVGWGGLWAMALSDDPLVAPAWPAALFWAGLAVAALEQRRRHQRTRNAEI